MLKFVVPIWLLLSVVLVPASFAEDAASAETNLGMLLPLSGVYATIGTDTRQGVEVALEELGSKQIKAVYGDSRTEPSHAISEFRKMVDVEKVVGVFAFRGPVGMPLNPLSKRSKVPLFGGVGNKRFARENPYAFQIWPPSDQEGQYIAKQILALGVSRIAVVTTQDDWLMSVSEGVKDSLKSVPAQVVFDQEVTPEEIDFRTLVLKLKKANPDVVFINIGLSQIGPMLRQLKQQAVKLPFFSNFWVNKPEVKKAAGAAAVEGVMFAGLSIDFPKLAGKLKQKYSSVVSGATLSAYVSTMLMGQALADLKGDVGTESFYNSLLKQKAVKTENGDFAVIERVVQLPMVVRVIKNGKAEVLG